MKVCTVCKQELSSEAFSKRARASDGLRSSCKKCTNANYKENIVKNKAQKAEFRSKNRERLCDIQKEYYKNNKVERNEYNKKYYLENKKEIIASNNLYYRNKRKTDGFFKLRTCITASVTRVLKSSGSSKNGESCLKYLGYTKQDLKTHIESQFEPWMNWDNQGVYYSDKWDDNDPSTWKWQLDHIIPHSELPYTSMEDDNFNKAWALSNLRPYSAKLNNQDGVRRTRHKKNA